MKHLDVINLIHKYLLITAANKNVAVRKQKETKTKNERPKTVAFLNPKLRSSISLLVFP